MGTCKSTGVPCISDKMKANASLNAIALKDVTVQPHFEIVHENDSTQNQFVRKLSRRLFFNSNFV